MFFLDSEVFGSCCGCISVVLVCSWPCVGLSGVVKFQCVFSNFCRYILVVLYACCVVNYVPMFGFYASAGGCNCEGIVVTPDVVGYNGAWQGIVDPHYYGDGLPDSHGVRCRYQKWV